MRPIPGQLSNAHQKRGFTLVELLVVVAIIALLAALTIRVVGGVLGNARKAATQATLKKIQELLKSRVQAVDRHYGMQIKNPTKLNIAIPNLSPSASSSEYAGGNLARARVIYRKALFKTYFPQTWAEAATAVADAGLTVPASVAGGPSESSEVLYFLLTKANVPGYEPVGVDAFTSAEVRDTDNDGMLEFIDSWGQPLRFYRWPTRLLKPTGDDGDDNNASDINRDLASSLISGLPRLPAQLNQDLDDPLGLLSNGNWTTSGGVTVDRARFETDFHTVTTYWSPLIVSPGPDLQLGLGEPNAGGTARLAAPASSDYSLVYDNISNLNLTGGGN